MGIKTDDLTCYPLCGERRETPGCHSVVGRLFTKEDRRAFEIIGAAWTQGRLILMSSDDRKLRAVLVKVGLVK
jgi:hypothetical protein